MIHKQSCNMLQFSNSLWSLVSNVGRKLNDCLRVSSHNVIALCSSINKDL